MHVLGDAFGVVGTLVAYEVEQPVLFDRPADGGAVLVVDVFRFGLGSVRGPLVRLQVLVGMEPEQGTVDGVGTALDLQGDRGAARQALFGVEGVGDDADLLDGLERRNISKGAINDSAAAGPVDGKVIDIGGRAIDGEVHRACRVRGEGVPVLRFRHAGDRRHEQLVVAANRHRHVSQRVPGDLRPDLGAVGLQGGRRSLYSHALGNLSESQGHVHAADRIGRDSNTGPGVALESRRADRNHVGSGRQPRQAVAAHGARLRFPGEIGLLIPSGHDGAGDGSLARIRHVAIDRSLKQLGSSPVGRNQRQSS